MKREEGRCDACVHWLPLTRGTLKTTGSMVLLVSISATATSTLRTLHSVLGRKARPCREHTNRK